MKNNLLIILFLNTFTLLLSAQNGFMKSYSMAGRELNGIGIIADSTGYSIVGSTDDCPNNSISCAGIFKTDLSGTLLWENSFNQANVQFFPNMNGFKRLNDTTYILEGNNTLQGYSWQNFFLKISPVGDSLKFIEHGSQISDKGGFAALLKHNIFAIGTSFDTPSNTHIKLLKMDFDLNAIDIIPLPNIIGCQKTFSETMAASPDSNYLYVGVNCQNIQSLNGGVRKIDTLGNEQWHYDLSGNVEYTNPQMRVKTMPNGNVIVKWFDSISNAPTGQLCYLLCLSSEGEFLWRYGFNSTYEKFIIDTYICANGDIIGCGYAYHPGYNYEVGVLVRLSPDGQLIWEREYISYTPSVNFLVPQSITEDPDGNIVVTGGIIEYMPNGAPAWRCLLQKVLPNGCFTPDCNGSAEDTLIIASTVVGIESPPLPSTQQQGKLIVLPNPAQNEVRVLIPLDLLRRPNASLQVSDLQGKTLKSIAIDRFASNSLVNIATNDLPNGVYLVSFAEAGLALQTVKLVVAH
jgi:hypothetical protein